MALIAGIDEAGLGPVLGPLVVSATAWSVGDDRADESMWRLLGGTVARTPSRHRGALTVADSKKLYHRRRPRALEHLERGVLAAVGARRARATSLRGLLRRLAPACLDALGGYPWYADADPPLPRCISPTDAALSANALTVAMERAGLDLLDLRAECLLVGEYNRLVRATQNKATTLFDVTCRLLMHLWRHLPPGRLRVVVDRHGGRVRYLPALQRVFDGGHFRVLAESETESAYAVTFAGRGGQVRFRVDADRTDLPVALASMVSKYLRELFMERVNTFWAARVPELAPTAGYYTDGRRFFRDILPAMDRLDIDRERVYRCR